jgi:hypothetical protein
MEKTFIYSKPSRKNFTALVECDRKVQEQLWELHKRFNEYVTKVLKEVFAAKHGKMGVEFQQVFAEIGGSQEAFARLNALTSVKSQPGVRVKSGTVV